MANRWVLNWAYLLWPLTLSPNVPPCSATPTLRCLHHQRRRRSRHDRRLGCLQHPGHHRPEWDLCRTGRPQPWPASDVPLLLRANTNFWNFSLQTIALTWWSLFRDSSYYILSVLTLIMVRCANHEMNGEAFISPPCVLTSLFFVPFFRLSTMPELSGEFGFSLYFYLLL